MPSVSALRIQPGTGLIVQQTLAQGGTAQTDLEPTNQTSSSSSTSVSLPVLTRLPAFSTSKLTMNELLYLVQNNADVQMTLATLMQIIFSDQSLVYTDGTQVSLTQGDANTAGSVNISTGQPSNSGNGGDLTISTGSAGANAGNANGGNVSITTGNGIGTGQQGVFAVSAGSVSFTCSDTGASIGADLIVYSGPAKATSMFFAGDSGSMSIGAGSVGAATGNGGAVGIYAGDAGASGGNGGGVTITSGNSTAGIGGSIALAAGSGGLTHAGNVNISAGNAGSGNTNGGNIVLTPGIQTGTGIAGQVILANIPTADPHVVGAVWSNNHVLTISAG